MYKEIGSDFYQYKITGDKKNEILKCYSEEKKIFTSSGRDAIRLLLENLQCDKRVLLPGFICETVIEPFYEYGYKVDFYNIDLNMEIDIADFNYKLKTKKPKVVLLINYFGFNKLGKKINSLDLTNELIIEDITQILFNKEFIKTDYKVASLRKWFAIPNGGVLISNHKIKQEMLKNAIIELDKKFIQVCKLKKEYLINKNGEKKAYMNSFLEIKDLIKKNKICKISSLSRTIWDKIDEDKIRKARYSNYKYLLSELKKIKEVQCIFKEIAQEEIPLYFPILINERNRIQKELIAKRIYCPVIWPKSKYVQGKINNTVEEVYNKILCIPCDQRYSIEEMKGIIEVIKKIYE